jgi:hypothetical protein
VRRYVKGDTPSCSLKWWRRFAADPMPERSATRSTGSVVPGVVDFRSVHAEDLARDGQLEDGGARLDSHSHPTRGALFAHTG